jgi:hypothetical protein
MGIGFYFAYGLLFFFGGLFLLDFIVMLNTAKKARLLMKYLIKYPDLYIHFTTLFSPYADNLFGLNFKWIFFFIKQVLTLGAFSKKRYGKPFNKSIKFEEIIKTKDKKLISLVRNYRESIRLSTLIFTLLLLSTLFVAIIFYFILKFFPSGPLL